MKYCAVKSMGVQYAFLNPGLMELDTELCAPDFTAGEVALDAHWTGNCVVCSRACVDTLVTKENF